MATMNLDKHIITVEYVSADRAVTTVFSNKDEELKWRISEGILVIQTTNTNKTLKIFNRHCWDTVRYGNDEE